MDSADLLRLHVKMAQIDTYKDGLSVRLSEIGSKIAQLNMRIDKEPRLRRRVGPMLMKLKHDLGHQTRAARVAIHKSETMRDEIFRTPIDVVAVERAMERSLKISARISKELSDLNSSLDELLAACGPLS
jgi:hypothetical protein